MRFLPREHPPPHLCPLSPPALAVSLSQGGTPNCNVFGRISCFSDADVKKDKVLAISERSSSDAFPLQPPPSSPPWTVGPSQCSKHSGAVRQHSWDGCLRACCKLMLQAPHSFCMEGEATVRKTSGEFEERLHIGGMKYLSLLLLLLFLTTSSTTQRRRIKKLPSVKMPCLVNNHKTQAGICFLKRMG